MKKQGLITLIVFALVCMSLFSCKKDDTTTTPVITPVTSGFTWKENSGALITADSAFWTTWTSGTGIRAYKGGMLNFFEINWATQNNTAIGTKTLLVSDFGFTFLKGSDTYTILTDQSLSVTAFANGKMSGNFTVAVTGPSITTIQATFTDLPNK